jgi:hypothetical protein
MALKAAGGAAGFPLTIATLQLGVGMLYALFLWVCTTPSPTVVYGIFAPGYAVLLHVHNTSA